MQLTQCPSQSNLEAQNVRRLGLELGELQRCSVLPSQQRRVHLWKRLSVTEPIGEDIPLHYADRNGFRIRFVPLQLDKRASQQLRCTHLQLSVSVADNRSSKTTSQREGRVRGDRIAIIGH